jgi:ferritin-like metal-binding protein YciE
MRTSYISISPGDTMSKVKISHSARKAAPIIDLFEEDLKDMYWAEKALSIAIPKMIQNTKSPELIESLTNQLIKVKSQVTRVEKVFKTLGIKTNDLNLNSENGLKFEVDYIMEPFVLGPEEDDGCFVEEYTNGRDEEFSPYRSMRQLPERKALRTAVARLKTSFNVEDDVLLDLAGMASDIHYGGRVIEKV